MEKVKLKSVELGNFRLHRIDKFDLRFFRNNFSLWMRQITDILGVVYTEKLRVRSDRYFSSCFWGFWRSLKVSFSIRKGKHVTWIVPLATMKNIGSPVLPVVGQHAVTSFVTIAPKKCQKSITYNVLVLKTRVTI